MNKLIVLTGPTAVGKTALSIRLAKLLDGEIISADSMQVYKGMDIGSAKIMPEETEGILHHLIDILEPDEEFNVYLFQQKARKALELIYQRGKLPIIVGGTGFYIQALLYDIAFETETEDDSVRLKYEEIARQKGNAYLHQLLEEVDAEAAAEIHENNSRRIIRALEFHEVNRQKISEHNRLQRQKQSAYQFAYYVLTTERSLLYERINARVDRMLQEGLLDEVKRLQAQGCTPGMTSMQGIGYKELLRYLNGEGTLEEAVEIIKRDSRHFAKRQLTWFRREKEVTWLNRQDFQDNDDAILQYIRSDLAEKGIIDHA